MTDESRTDRGGEVSGQPANDLAEEPVGPPPSFSPRVGDVFAGVADTKVWERLVGVVDRDAATERLRELVDGLAAATRQDDLARMANWFDADHGQRIAELARQAVGASSDWLQEVSEAAVAGHSRLIAEVADRWVQPVKFDWDSSIGLAIRESLPPNWQDIAGSDTIESTVAEDGIPLVWVPRGSVVAVLLRAGSRAARLRVLVDSRGEIIEDCRACLSECHHDAVATWAPMAQMAVEALADGHGEAAHALAVVTAESIIRRFVGWPYQAAREKAKFDRAVGLRMFRTILAVAPIVPFFAAWHPTRNHPAPSALSRHVSVHEPTVNHYSAGNSLIATMLLVSLLREVCAWQPDFVASTR